ncbi:ScbR family autoregulator-binding transcription factor [Streptomyces flavalbus]|uniref:ScbR family autoregulator-binding transcription factor n=1 Tax=Streptomyces flavalbus TaxID=2665155 RepID=A0ABW2WAI1_9ACTN
MAKQARAVQTRRAIVEAAASVFDDYGYERAALSEILRRAEVTKGALYFHFPSKESLAQAIMDEQTTRVRVPESGSRLQALVDITHQFAYSLAHDPLARAGTRLSIEGVFLNGVHPWGEWFDLVARLLTEAKEAGEVLPQVNSEETAEFIVSAFTGVQLVSEAITKRTDLRGRVAILWHNILPAITYPGVIIRIKPEGATDPSLARDDDETAAEAPEGAEPEPLTTSPAAS